LVGGNGVKRTLSYVVRYADEWNCVSLTPQEFTDSNTRLDEMLDSAGRKPESVRRSMMTGCVFGKDNAALNEKIAARGKSLEQLQQGGVVVGNLDQVKKQLHELDEAGLQRIMLQWLDLDDLESLETLAKGTL
jgi:alkanesulfonate monooxygenase SsuD/methylene tetrahydromethanopterin reductase-like flavin-dependent oxidoreductase (luciferase family)